MLPVKGAGVGGGDLGCTTTQLNLNMGVELEPASTPMEKMSDRELQRIAEAGTR